MTVFVGTSGWQYRHWRGTFYPRELPVAGWLSYFAGRFRLVEVNNTFYRLPGRESFTAWAEQTPDDFVFVVKFSRYLTHIKRLKDPREPIQHFLEAARPLGPKMGPLLLQLPPNMPTDAARLREALQSFPADVQVAVEFRHDSWYADSVHAVLEERGAALCVADRGSRPITPLWRTAPWGYIRFHFGTGHPESCHERRALAQWAARIAEQWANRTVYVFFNNDPHACAIHDASVLSEELDAAGLQVTRVPAAQEVRLA